MANIGELDDVIDLPALRSGLRPKLCIRCENFDIQSFTRTPTRRRGYALRDVQSSAEDGCEFCVLLWDSVRHVQEPEYFHLSLIPGRLRTTNQELYVHMTASRNYGAQPMAQDVSQLNANRLLIQIGDRFSNVKTDSQHEVCLAADPDSGAAQDNLISGRYNGSHPDSEMNYIIIRNLINTCIENHPKCNQTVSGSLKLNPEKAPLPVRCIEVLGNGDRIRLRETERDTGTYITLTHRWSKETKSCSTTKRNYIRRLQGQAFQELPQLFLDAFSIAVKLGVRYVWIDSLCIIQDGDGKADWKRQAPMMAEYYQNSYLTIAGTMENMGSGILKPYGDEIFPWDSRLIRLPYRNKSGQLMDYFYTYKRRVSLVDEYWNLVRESVVFKRAWILQEWLLSKRILWYTSSTLFFECHSETPQTTCREQIASTMAKPDLRFHLNLKSTFHFSAPSILDFWYRVLEVYSAFDVSFTSDRIVAVAGLANEVVRILADSKSKPQNSTCWKRIVYLSGLWLQDIHHGLLWEIDPSAPQWVRKVDDAPSWSWASLMTPVKWPHHLSGVQKEMTVIGVCLQKRDGQHTAQKHVSTESTLQQASLELFDPSNMSSCLHIRGKLQAVHIHGYLKTKEKLRVAAIATLYDPAPVTGRWRAVCSKSRSEVIVGWASLERKILGETGCADIGVAVLALLISTSYRHTRWLLKCSNPTINVLFLVEQHEGTKVYQRIGVGRIFGDEIIDDFHNDIDQEIQLV